MIMICNNCGCVFEDDEFVYEEECVGECWGRPAYQTVASAPCCGEYDCREAKCADCAHAVPCALDGDAVDCFDEACSSFELKEETTE